MPRPVDATRGPLLPTLLRLAVPVVLMQTAHTAFHLVNMVWIGRLGASATAALSGAWFLLWTINAFADIASVAITATVARHVGARDPARAAEAAGHGLALSLLLGVLVAVAGEWLVRPLVRLVGLAPDVSALALSYLRIALALAPVTFAYYGCEAVMRGAGDTRTPLLIVTVGLGLNAALDPLLIFGLGPFPRLGVAGAALATVVAQCVAVAWFVTLAARKHAAFPFARGAFARPAPRMLGAMVVLGAPVAAIGVLFSVVYLFFAWTVARFGTGAVALLGVGTRVESIVYLVSSGFGLACESLVGQNLGARLAARAERGVWLSAGLVSAFGLVMSLAMWFVPTVFLGLFLTDTALVHEGIPYLRILALNEVFTGFELVMNGGFAGAGDTRPPSAISVVVSLLRLPLAWWFGVRQGGGLLAVGWVITVTAAVRGAALLAWFQRGAWKHKALATADARVPALRASEAPTLAGGPAGPER